MFSWLFGKKVDSVQSTAPKIASEKDSSVDECTSSSESNASGKKRKSQRDAPTQRAFSAIYSQTTYCHIIYTRNIRNGPGLRRRTKRKIILVKAVVKVKRVNKYICLFLAQILYVVHLSSVCMMLNMMTGAMENIGIKVMTGTGSIKDVNIVEDVESTEDVDHIRIEGMVEDMEGMVTMEELKDVDGMEDVAIITTEY